MVQVIISFWNVKKDVKYLEMKPILVQLRTNVQNLVWKSTKNKGVSDNWST